jgi:dTMP kinase
LLENQKYPTLATREPGGNVLAEKIRSLILEIQMHPKTELLLYEAARAEHIAVTVLPALKAGKVVLCDRFIDSTLAYQAFARGLPWREVKTLNRFASFGIKPHLTVLLDIEPEVGLQRVSHPNRFESEGIEFQKKVRQGYKKARSENPQRWITLQSGTRPPEILAASVLEQIKKRLRGYFKNAIPPS